MGDSVGVYSLGNLLGSGGMGRVYAAEDASGKPVAIKLLRKTLQGDPMLVTRMLDEARAAREVSHRNVVRALAHGDHQGAPYMVMERAPGVPLGTLIQERGALPLTRARSIASQILSGLAAIHRAGLVHGDMKSDNVLVDEHDRVTIIDFGLARRQGTRPEWLDEHMLSGTPEYMAPELVRGQPLTVAAEIYAVGVILYEMVTGSTPFGGGTTTAIFERHLSDEIVPPSLRCPDQSIPAQLESLIMRALDKDPASRHFNAELFATAVERAISPSHVEPKTRRASEVAQPPRSVGRDRDRKPTVGRQLARPRLAEGTARRDSPHVQTARAELHDAVTSGDANAIIVATLALVQALLDDHRLAAAAHELSRAITALEPAAPPQLWRLHLTLAAVQDGLGEPELGGTSARAALDAARGAADPTGMARSQRVLQRIAGSRRSAR